MKLTNEQLKDIYFGAYFFEETTDGYLKANQYSKEQMAYFDTAFEMWKERCDASTAKTLEFITEATEISFDYKLIWFCSKDSFDLYIDEELYAVTKLDDIKEEGRLTFNMREGKKKVTVYLPCDATAIIKNFEINDSYETVTKGSKVLWLGDSITQGYGPLRSSQSYVSVANRILDYDIINQGIGGYVYDKKSLMKMEGYNPEKIIVAMGTNQYGTESMIDIEEYYETLAGIYGNTPILCVTPLWRGDHLDEIDKLIRFCDELKKIVSKYPNIKVVDGFKLVPHFEEYYLDNLHPNKLGTEVYGRNLVREIERLGF